MKKILTTLVLPLFALGANLPAHAEGDTPAASISSDPAIAEAQKAVERAEASNGQNHANVAATLNNLAELYFAKHQYSKAEPLLTRAIDIWEKTDPNGLGLSSGLNNLAELYEAQQRDCNQRRQLS
jgi:tetratricopeptide (TPR) repeat protein